jgi:hypothetical protein
MTLRKWFLTSAALCVFTQASWAGKEQLQKVPGKNIHQKIITTTKIIALYDEPDGKKKDYVQSYSVFFKLKAPANFAAKTDWTLIGDQNGKPIGWIKNKETTKDGEVSSFKDWNTRFVLEPKRNENIKFSVSIDGGGVAEYKSEDVGATNKRLAMIVDTPAKEQGEDTEYPVLVYTGPIADKEFSALKNEVNILDNLKMEVVFVVESTPGMENIKYFDTDGKVTDAMEVTKAIIFDTVQELKKKPEVAKSVRFGLVEFQDDVKEADFISKVSQDLTNDPEKILSSLTRIRLCKNSGDWPEDVLAGLNTAVEKISWDKTSLKHIVLIGTSSAQLDKKGEGEDQYGNPGSLGEGRFFGYPRKKTNNDQGWNTTGLQISDLIKKARPQGGADTSKDLGAKTFHTVIIGKELIKLPADFPFKAEEFSGDISYKEANIKIMNSLTRIKGSDLQILKPDEFKGKDQQANDTANILQKVFTNVSGDIEKINDETLKSAVNQILGIVRRKLNESFLDGFHFIKGKDQYKKISDNQGHPGYLAEIEPKMESANQVRDDLSKKLIQSFSLLVNAKKQGEAAKDPANPFAQGLYNIIGADKNKFKNAETMAGKASSRDKEGCETAVKKVLVSKDELRHLKSTFDSLYDKFKNKTKKADRQDVSEILKEIKQLIVEAGVGENLTDAKLSESKLEELITDLPLKTDVLKMSAKDIAVMPSDSFKNWLENIDFARKRCVQLLDNEKEFNAVNELSAAKEFTFVRLSELP